MGHSSRKRKTTVRVGARRWPFLVQIAVPEAGFGLKLDAINAWHRYTKIKQRRAQPHQAGPKKFGRWCFETLESAERFKERFGGEIVPATAALAKRDLVGAFRMGKLPCGTNDEPIRDSACTGNSP
jgi:hypothetical protein